MYVIWDPEAYNVLCPANSYSAHLGGTKIINKGVIKLRIKQKKEEKRNTTTHRKKNPSHKLKHMGFVIRKKKTKITMEVYTTYRN